MLVVQVQYPSVPPLSKDSYPIPLHPAQINLLAQLVPSMDGYTVVERSLYKMVQNGAEYGRMRVCRRVEHSHHSDLDQICYEDVRLFR